MGPMHDTDSTNLAGRRAVGCVSFLNARPLIDGLDGRDEMDVVYDVPSGLLGDLLAERVDLALCPVIDFQTAERPLRVVPVGGIGCDGPTLTVRLYSRVPIEEIHRVHADTDSHTSVVLMRLLLHDVYGATPEVVNLAAGRADTLHGLTDPADAVLLIGDKVITAAPPDSHFPYQVDLGSAWKDLTGLPFVFAVWMARRGTDLGPLPALLDAHRRANRERTDAIADAHAPKIGWPADVARRSLGELLRYDVGPTELEAMQRFWARAHQLGLIDRLRPLELYEAQRSSTPSRT